MRHAPLTILVPRTSKLVSDLESIPFLALRRHMRKRNGGPRSMQFASVALIQRASPYRSKLLYKQVEAPQG
jgi:hypothetical protein